MQGKKNRPARRRSRAGDAIPLYAATDDVICDRIGQGLPGDTMVNIPQRVRHHSPTGFEWSYHGSGPADLALNILDRYLPPIDQEDTVVCWDGNVVSESAWELHQEFKRLFVATIPYEGGIIRDAEIRAFLAEHGYAV